MISKDTSHQNVSYARRTICKESRSTCDDGEGTALCTNYKLSSKKSFLVKTKPCPQNTCMKKPLTYSSEKLKQIGEKNGTKILNLKLPYQMLGVKNKFFEKTDRPKYSDFPFSTPPHPTGCDGTGSPELNLCNGRGEGQKISQTPSKECLTGAKHDHTYAKKIAVDIKKQGAKPKKQTINLRKNAVNPNKQENAFKKTLEFQKAQNEKLWEPQNAKASKIKFFCLNVGGLKSKLIAEDFKEVILEYDIVCLLEIKMDLNDVGVLETDFEQYKILTNLEVEYEAHPRGGIHSFFFIRTS